jgi:hypothetical protein
MLYGTVRTYIFRLILNNINDNHANSKLIAPIKYIIFDAVKTVDKVLPVQYNYLYLYRISYVLGVTSTWYRSSR